MGKEIIAIAEALSNERAIPRDKIFEALETALATATKKKYPVDIAVRVTIDKKEGSYRTFRRWTVVGSSELDHPASEISLEAARLDYPEINVGDVVEEEIESVAFDRITIQTAKQVLSQKVKDAERDQLLAEQRQRVGQVINATVKKQGRDFLVLDLGNNAEAVLKKEQLIPHETFGRGDRIKVLLSEIKNDNKNPQIVCSRTSPQFLKELFKIEVPEIGEDIIEIMGVARDPGSRAKISVRTKDRRIDPRGACIGMRGARVMAVSNELAGEKIDVVLYDENLAQYVTNAMEPAEVSRIIINEETHSIDIAVADDNLALAIGRNGQNVKLASNLIGWNLEVMTETSLKDTLQKEQGALLADFVEGLNIDEDFAQTLIDYGFTNLEEIAYVVPDELLQIEGLDMDMVEALQNNAKHSLEKRAELENQKALEVLTSLEGIDNDLAQKLIEHDIKSADALAELATDDLVDIEGLDEATAGKIIMAARNECWFKDAK